MDQKEFNSEVLSILSNLASSIQGIADSILDLGALYHDVEWIQKDIAELTNKLYQE